MVTDDRPVMVSIKCTVYNHEPYLRQCLDGFVMQKTNFRFEAIVHDDASTDGSAAIIREYAKKYPDIIKPIYQTENKYTKPGGIDPYINPLLTGKYIAICEGDDYWIDPYKLQKQVDYLEKEPQCAMVYTKASMINGSDKREIGVLGEETDFYKLLKGYNTIPTASVCYRNDISQEYLEFVSSAIKGWRMGDYPFNLYITRFHGVYFLDEKTCVYRVLENSASHSKDQTKLIPYYNSILDIKLFFYNRLCLNSPKFEENLYYNQFVLFARLYIKAHNPLLKQECIKILPHITGVKSMKKYLYIAALNNNFISILLAKQLK